RFEIANCRGKLFDDFAKKLPALYKVLPDKASVVYTGQRPEFRPGQRIAWLAAQQPFIESEMRAIDGNKVTTVTSE
ncbi:hypothetical protein OFN56_38870, partial [Escherichia coli]|nr:hypothetical protein [Escherichia coli]